MIKKRKFYGASIKAIVKWRVSKGMPLRLGDWPAVKAMMCSANVVYGNV